MQYSFMLSSALKLIELSNEIYIETIVSFPVRLLFDVNTTPFFMIAVRRGHARYTSFVVFITFRSCTIIIKLCIIKSPFSVLKILAGNVRSY